MLELKHITKVYRPKKGVPVKALDNVSLKIQSKGMVFILGKSGSGKSTLLNIIGGLDRYDHGELIIKGKSSKDFTQSDFDSYRNTYVGFIFQEYNILEDFSVGANIGLALELQGKKATEEAINRILQQVDLEGYGHRKPNELSGGQKQRVAIARALVKEPEIILADEPTGNLDSETGKQVFDTLKKLSQEKLVIVVSHDREFAETYGDRIIELADGKIIRDIERVKRESSSQSVHVIDNRFIRIRKGYQLSQEDLEKINDFLLQAENDALLCLDRADNTTIRSLAEKDVEGQTTTFAETNQERIAQHMGIGDAFRLIKSRLPLKNAIRIGASGLKIKPIRLAFTILLSVVAFTLFGLADTVGSYDRVSNMVQSIEDHDIHFLSITKANKIYYHGNRFYSETVRLRQKHIDELTKQLNLSFHRVYDLQNNDFYHHLMEDRYSRGNLEYLYFLTQFGGIIELSEEQVKDYGFSITGKMPKTNKEVAITQYIFEHFQHYGFRSNHPDHPLELSKDEITDAESFLAKNPTLYVLDDYYTITGIIDTKLNKDRYSLFFENNPWNAELSYFFLHEELKTVVLYGFHSLIFAGPGILDDKGSDLLPIVSIDNYGELIAEIQPHKDAYISYMIDAIMNEKDFEGTVIFFDKGRTEHKLRPEEVLLNIADLIYIDSNDRPQLMDDLQAYLDVDLKPEHIPNELTGYTFAQYVTDYLFQAIYDYAAEHIDTAILHGWPDTGDKIDRLADALLSSLLYENPYLPDGKPGLLVLIDALIDVIEDYQLWDEIQQFYQRFRIHSNYYQNAFDFSQFQIVGLFIPDPSYYRLGGSLYSLFSLMIFSSESFEAFIEYIGGEFAFVITKMPTKRADIRHVVQSLDNRNITPYYHYQIQNEVSYLINNIGELAEDLASIFLYIGIAFCLFASLLLFNFIATSINYKRREIGILRAIGARSKDVFSIFFSESLLIAMISYVLTTFATFIIVIVINQTLRADYGILLTFFRFGLRQVLLLFVISVGVAFCASFIPVYRTARKKPIEAIRD